MDTTLIINFGSTSKKYAIYEGGEQKLTVTFEKVGSGFQTCTAAGTESEACTPSDEEVFDRALEHVLKIAEERGITKNDITQTALRVVAPGTFFQEHREIDEEFLERLKKREPTAPLHIPPIFKEVERLRTLLPEVRHYAISDSAFHRTIPGHARIYSIPRSDAEALDMYRFGYHGISMGSALRSAQETLGEIPSRVVLCHVGGGASVAAIREGVSIDTSMGFTPASGLMMTTRAGDIDPGALIHLMAKKELSGNSAHAYIQKEGGFQGLIGTGDLREALEMVKRGDAHAEEAVRMFFYLLRREIGASIAALEGIDVLILTGTAPERNGEVRTRITEGLTCFGVLLDQEKNISLHGGAGIISGEASPVCILVVRTDEMGEMSHLANSLH